MKSAASISRLIVLLLLAQPVFAAGWSGSTSVTEIRSSTTRVLIVLDNMPNPDGCSSAGFYLLSTANNDLFAEMFSLLVTAHAGGTFVNIQVSGCSVGGRPEISEVVSF